MAINSVSYSGSLFGQAVLNLNNQLTNLSTQLATGEKSTTYAGMGINEGFAIAARQQLSNISAYGDTITNVGTTIDAENTALQSISSIATAVQGDASTTPQNLSSTGQTIGQQNAQSELVSLVGILNTQVGDRYIFSGSAINTPSVASSDEILNGTSTQAGLTQLIAERAQADGTTGLGRLVISTPNTTTTGTPPATTSTTSFEVSEDAAGSPFGLKLGSVQSTLTGATVTGPSGSPASVSFSFGATNPNPGDQVTLNFNLPDGTTSSVTLTASSANPPPTGTFSIGATPAATAANLNSALNTSIGTLANTTLVAASAVAAGNDFFDPSSSATGAVATNQQTPPQPITNTTALSGAAGTDSLSASFASGDTITVNGTTISFSATAPTSTSGSPYVINTASGTVGNLLSAIDSITGTTTPSSIDGGAVTINTPSAGGFSISASSSTAQNALAALGFSQAAGTATTAAGVTTITAPQPPLRVSTSGSVTGAAAVDQETTPLPIASSTALSGIAGSASLSAGFADGDAISVNGKTITFSNGANSLTGPTYNINPATSSVGNLLSAIDSITGTTTPSSISGGAVTINTPNAANFSISALSTDPNAQAALAALGFSSASGTATTTAGGTNITANATSLVNGSANTVAWYTGNNSSDPRASANALVDSGISVNYGIQANEQAIRQQLEGIAVYAAVTESPTATNSPAQAAALSSRIASNLTSQPGQQQISDIQTDLANAQTTMQAASARQTQSQSVLQNMIDSTETVSTEQVASQILAIQSSLSASYQTTSMLSQLTLTKFLSGGV
jgi:flagellar hook-associated protein 3 FlgL